MNTRLGLVIAAFSFIVIANNTHAIMTIGDRSCGQWSSRKENPYLKMVVHSWLMGFMSGLAVGTDEDVIAGTDGESIDLWMDNYCHKHPLERLSMDASLLYFELKARQK